MEGGRNPGFLARLGLARPDARAWVIYDWGNSAFFTVVVAAVFPAYFADVAAAGLDPEVAQSRFSLATTLALAAVAVSAPLLGAMADARAIRKRLLAAFALLGALATALLFFVDGGEWRLGLFLFGLGNVGAAGSLIFYDALLPHVAREGEVDRLSTTGFAVGYVGGGLLLLLNVLWIVQPGWFGLPSGEGGHGTELSYRLAFVSVAVWWVLFTIPLMRRVAEPPASAAEAFPGAAGRQRGALLLGLARLRRTFRDLRLHRQAFLLLIAFLVYNDGILTIIRMAGIYARSRDVGSGVIITTILLVQFVGVPFSILFGRLAGTFGAKRMIQVGLLVYAGIALLAYFMTSSVHFVVLGLLVGMVQGGVQALSRSLFASVTPRHKSAEFFALFAVGEKFAGILGPLLWWVLIETTGSSRNAVLSVIAFFAVGGLLLRRVDVEEGRRAALASEQAAG